MRRWVQAVLFLSTFLIGSLGASVAGASAQALVPGGLTALPAPQVGGSVGQNGGFEQTNGSQPTGWSGHSAFKSDQLVKRSGGFSVRLDASPSHGQFYTLRQTVQLKRGLYKLSGWIKTASLGTNADGAGMRIVLDYRPEINDWYPSAVARGTHDWKHFEVMVNVPGDRKAYLSLEAYRGPSGQAWVDDVKLEPQVLPVDAYLLYPNYRGMLFDDQSPVVRFDVRVTPPGDDFGRHQVRVRLQDEATGQALATEHVPAQARLTAQVDGSAMQAGRPYLATVSLIDQASNATVYSYPAYRVSKVPASARETMNIAFDEQNRLLIRGTPRFALGVYDSGLAYNTTDSYWKSTLWSPGGARRMDGLRINFYLNYHYGQATAAAMNALMTNLQKRGVMWLQTANCFAGSAHDGPYKFVADTSYAFVRDTGAHAFLADSLEMAGLLRMVKGAPVAAAHCARRSSLVQWVGAPAGSVAPGLQRRRGRSHVGARP